MSSEKSKIPTPNIERQVSFHELLLAIRKTWLADGLDAALAEVNPVTVREQILQFAPPRALQVLAAAGIRDERVFPVPVVLMHTPTLVGYYRLLTGISQKSFYRSGTGMAPFSVMESKGLITKRAQNLLPEFCRSMGTALGSLVEQTATTLAPRDIEDLQLLTLGSFLYGSSNNTVGATATLGVFAALKRIFYDFIEVEGAQSFEVRLPSGRTMLVALASDPDVRIVETTGGLNTNLIAIEIKGGSDIANVYNRGGEAEKSHQGAKQAGFRECWTVIRQVGVDLEKLYRGSPSTDLWLDTAQILAQKGTDWELMSDRLAASILEP